MKINERISRKPPKIAIITVFTLPLKFIWPVVKNQKSKASTAPAASRISQMAVACLKLLLKERKKDLIVESSSSRTIFSVT